MVRKMALGQVFPEHFGLHLSSTITPALRVHLSIERWKAGPPEFAVTGDIQPDRPTKVGYNNNNNNNSNNNNNNII